MGILGYALVALALLGAFGGFVAYERKAGADAGLHQGERDSYAARVRRRRDELDELDLG